MLTIKKVGRAVVALKTWKLGRAQINFRHGSSEIWV